MASPLYGSRDPSKQKHKPISSSSSLAFSSNLSNLISSAKSPSNANTSSKPKPKPNTSKTSVFSAQNKNVKKRAMADEQQDQQHRTSATIGHASESELHRSKRKMLEKTRLYNAMKRGEYLNQSNYDDRSGLVDFDRKWAESQGQTNDHDSRPSSQGSSDDDDDDDNDSSSTASRHRPSDFNPKQWTDEFGRLITGTASQHRRHLRRQRIAAAAEAAFEQDRARPSQPSEIIYGDTIQHAAFNPDTVVQDRMAELVAKRDKEATPPPDTHYNAQAEIRTKGTGFYGFSQDEELRKKEMEGLENERAETDRKRREREEAKMARMREIEERRKLVRERKAKREVDAFLDGLDVSLPVSSVGESNVGGAETHTEQQSS